MKNIFSDKGNCSLENLPLLTFLEKSKIPWAVKSVESRFAFVNEPAKDFLRIPNRFDFEGRLDEDFPTPWSEMAEEYRAHDRKAESSPDGAEIITTSYFTRHAVLEPWYCHKFPIFDAENQVTGTLFYAKKGLC